jgi:hypothetical protein
MISNYERMISRNGGVSALSSHSLPQMLVIARAGFVFVFKMAIMVQGRIWTVKKDMNLCW